MPRKYISDDDFCDNLFAEQCDGGLNFDDIFMDCDFIKKVIKKLPNNAPIGPNWVSVSLLKNGGSVIVQAIADIGRLSLLEAKLPHISKFIKTSLDHPYLEREQTWVTNRL